MSWEAWLTVVVVLGLLVGLARGWAGADLLCLACLAVLVLVGELSGTSRLPSAKSAVASFGNSGLVTVGLLFIVVTGLVKTGALALVVQPLLGRPTSERSAVARLMLPVTGLSAFLNNTPVVAMFMPVVRDLSRRTGVSPSKLYLPLSYAAIFGGICTLIGTSTNLVVHGLLLDSGRRGFGMFDLAWVGVPGAVLGTLYMLTIGRRLLPNRTGSADAIDNPRRYSVEALVDPAGPLVGRSVEQAGLRHLPGLYLAEVIRDGGEVLPAVGPQQVLRAGDRLVFVGVVESVIDLLRIRGLSAAPDAVFELQTPRTRRLLIEAVISDRCPVAGRSIRACGFRARYGAVVLAVSRGGEQLKTKIGDVVLRPGDTLLLEAGPGFSQRYALSDDFYLISALPDSAPVRHHRAWLAIGVLITMVALASAGVLSMLAAALVAAVVMVAARCCTGGEARASIEWPVLIVIGAALGLGQALEVSGAASAVASAVIGLAGSHPLAVLASVYLVTTLLTELITNNAAAVLVYAVAVSAADRLGVDAMPFAVAIAIAASASFATPIGYQTNLMVYGPGGYRFGDYLRVGIPLNLLFMVVALIVIPLVWPLKPY